MATPAVAWFDVTGKDGTALQEFYSQLFDWQIQDAGFADPEGHVVGLSKGAVQ